MNAETSLKKHRKLQQIVEFSPFLITIWSYLIKWRSWQWKKFRPSNHLKKDSHWLVSMAKAAHPL